ncbi:methyl-CpG-binding domain-containing protein 4-like [Ananas comosus]|uniref:Methyl-CpG-binding domain-containing protein 4 n=1 Tax=Ananas comosus TaxID=4615 RepID=A0A199VCI5_ANACO|nr:methyl-CpG-binding domain-containing protein 4-like [Ananas comosus]OAY74581.1 Methyl-CpG-binding domain-containing protein 4 [Ananas comosus]
MEKKRKSNDSINAYSVQCENCLKWRLIPTKEEYETIRHNFIDDPWVCSKKPNASCDDPAGDIEYDNTRIWVIDKPNIPKPPPDTERILIMRKDLSKMDTYYIMPKGGKKARCSGDVEKFLEANPEYKDTMSVSSFSFTAPKIMEETVSRNSEVKASAKSKLRIANSDNN